MTNHDFKSPVRKGFAILIIYRKIKISGKIILCFKPF